MRLPDDCRGGSEVFLEAQAAPGVHEKILQLLKKKQRGRLLDAPAGEGALSFALKERGFDVFAADLEPGKFRAPGLTCRCVDLNGSLPYEADFFDYVVCVEGIEHIENPHHLIREFSRVLKKGGELIVTTPNIQSLASRAKFFLFGSFRYFNAKIDIADPSLRGHINPLTFSELEMILSRCGFSALSVSTNRPQGNFILRGVSFLWGLLSRFWNKADNPFLATPPLVFGDILILSAKKGL